MNGPDTKSWSALQQAGTDRRLRILTWHVHGNYLYSLGHLPHEIYVPVSTGGEPGYGPLGDRIPWGGNMHELAPQELQRYEFDCIIYQSRSNWEDGQRLLTPSQRRLPCVYLEHNPPEPHAAESRHLFAHERGMLVHVTTYNALMWDNGDTPWRVVEHGVAPPVVQPPAETLARGIVVVNHLHRRGRRLGADLFTQARRTLALDLIGMESERLRGLGEIPNMEVAAFMARYRYFFSPVRYGSLSLALIEAMMAGLPVVGVGTTALPGVVSNGVDGYVDTDMRRLMDVMRTLATDEAMARQWGLAAQSMARRRFGIERFVDDWNTLLQELALEVSHGE